MFSKIVCASLAGCLAVGPASAQRARRTILRLEAGMLNPDDLFRVTLALGGSVGWQATPRTAVLVRYLRQSHDRNTAQDIGSRGRGFLTANWQYGFGAGGQYRRQAMLRIGGGALFRYQLATAPVVGAGLEVRYPVAEQLAFIGSIEDDAAALPRQVFVSCAPLFGNVVCTNYVYGDKVQHNVGFVVAVEWRP